MKRQLAAGLGVIALVASTAGSASAADTRTGYRACGSNYSVALSTTTTSSSQHGVDPVWWTSVRRLAAPR